VLSHTEWKTVPKVSDKKEGEGLAKNTAAENTLKLYHLGAGIVVQVVESLLSKSKVLNSNTSTAKKKKNRTIF
jgi:hypothetical protein